jgi:hypothetical protein
MNDKLKSALVEALNELTQEGSALPYKASRVTGWTEEALDAIRKAYSEEAKSVADEKVKAFKAIKTSLTIAFGDEPASEWEEAFTRGMQKRVEFLASVKKYLERY